MERGPASWFKHKAFDRVFAFEVVLLILFNVIVYALSSQVDLLEGLYFYSREHEDLELDELVPVFISLALSLLIFAERRRRLTKQLQQELFTLSTHDTLTGCYNRQYLQEAINLEIERFDRSGAIFSLIMIDIDNFKEINDTLGHEAGDKALQEFCTIIEDNSRRLDSLARWGGEEFIILCRDTKAPAAEHLANRILEAVRETKFSCDRTLTFSAGVSQVKQGYTANALVKVADDRLYAAKAAGKNQIIGPSSHLSVVPGAR